MTRLCRDCAHARPPLRDRILGWFAGGTYTFAKCLHPSAYRPGQHNLATGAWEPGEQWYASTMRQSWVPGDCGPEGRFWEPKRTKEDAR